MYFVSTAETWPGLMDRLGKPILANWSNTGFSDHIVQLKRWLEDPQTKTQDVATARGKLILALYSAGVEMVAKDIAAKLDIPGLKSLLYLKKKHPCI